MDSSIVNKKAIEYSDRVLRLTPAVIAQIGIIKQGIHLKIDEFFISCVPFDLSLGKASLLGTLSNREIEFFSSMIKRAHKLNLIFMIPSSKKPVNFFALSDILAFRKPNPDSPYCFIDVRFRETPFVLKEILVEYWNSSDESEFFFKDPTDVQIPPERFGLVFDHPHLVLLKEGVSSDRLRIVGLSKRLVRLFGEYEGPAVALGEQLDFEGSANGGPLSFQCICTVFKEEPELPGFSRLDAELQFNALLSARILKAAGGMKSRSQAGT
ncbi:MAG: hypothetical protein WCQ50_13965 [Spirochaetota bacterium]